MELLPLQPGDVPASHADVTWFWVRDNWFTNWTLKFEDGVKKIFTDWYLNYTKKID